MDFRKYESVERFGKEDTEGILNGIVYITEKVDGCSISIFKDVDKGLTITSRNRILYTEKDGLIDNMRNVVNIIKDTTNILDMVNNHSNQIFYCEFSCKHTIKYPIENTNQLFFFDVYDKTVNEYMPFDYLIDLTLLYKIKTVPLIGVIENPSLEDCKQFMNVNGLKGYPQQEGIVIRNYHFRNKFRRLCYAKIVNEQFKELNREIFGKRSKCCHWQVEDVTDRNDEHKLYYFCSKCKQQCEVEIVESPKKEVIETKIALKYCTQARVEKIINKIIDIKENRVSIERPTLIEHKTYLVINHTPEVYKVSEKDIPQLLGMVFNDIIKEESWEIIKEFKNPTINYKNLQREITNLTKQYFFKYLEEKYDKKV